MPGVFTIHLQMRFLNIASGSSGNATYIGTDHTHILIDAGISRKRITEGLQDADVTLSDIDAILITHEHIDHISSLGVLLRTREIPVYATRGTIDGILANPMLGSYPKDLFVPIEADRDFRIGDLSFLPLSISHDANDPVCYRFSGNGRSGAVVTDLGIWNAYLEQNLQDLNFLMLEANHDKRMLEVGPYPYPLKRRILGEKGHLSNEDAGLFLSQLLHDNMIRIMLGHISRENNTREIALLSVENEINGADNPYHADDFDILAARRDAASQIFEV